MLFKDTSNVLPVERTCISCYASYKLELRMPILPFNNATSSGRALAHELGHLLGLDHLKVDYQNERLAMTQVNNLMVEGLTVGTSLTPDQIKAA